MSKHHVLELLLAKMVILEDQVRLLNYEIVRLAEEQKKLVDLLHNPVKGIKASHETPPESIQAPTTSP